MSRALALLALTIMTPVVANAQVELSFYGGAQSAPASDVSVRDGIIGNDDFSISWEGRSSAAPIYYGIRATHWQSDTFGYGLDFAHNKIYPKDGELPAGYDVLEFTDGLNTLTVNAYRRWNDAFGGLTPYVGGGIGVAIPHVEVTNGASETFGYPLTGSLVQPIQSMINGRFLANTRARIRQTKLILIAVAPLKPTCSPMR